MDEFKIRKIVTQAIEEDIGTGDITTESVVEDEERSSGKIKFKENGVLAGLPVAELVFKEIDDGVNFQALKKEGQTIRPGEVVAEGSGRSASILKGERLALNFLQRLSGIATKTRRYVKEVEDYDVKVVDTRKTTPNLRILEKYAVKIGGGYNHRMGLYDAVLIKDNHIRSAGGIEEAVARGGHEHTLKIEVEVESVEDVKKAIRVDVDIVMLDNMSMDEMKEAVRIIGDEAVVEASGGIDIHNIKEVAATGVDVISIGALTHQISSLDISLDLF